MMTALVFGLMMLMPAADGRDGGALLVHNAIVYTVESDNPVVSAFVVQKGHFVFVGDADVALERYPHAEQLDAGGRTIIPGLIDAHAHLMGLGMSLLQADLMGAASVDEIIHRLREVERSLPDEAWLIGRGWDQNLWSDDGSFPSRQDLDEAFPDRPVWLVRVDGHAGWANTAALPVPRPGACRGSVQCADPPIRTAASSSATPRVTRRAFSSISQCHLSAITFPSRHRVSVKARCSERSEKPLDSGSPASMRPAPPSPTLSYTAAPSTTGGLMCGSTGWRVVVVARSTRYAIAGRSTIHRSGSPSGPSSFTWMARSEAVVQRFLMTTPTSREIEDYCFRIRTALLRTWRVQWNAACRSTRMRSAIVQISLSWMHTKPPCDASRIIRDDIVSSTLKSWPRRISHASLIWRSSLRCSLPTPRAT